MPAGAEAAPLSASASGGSIPPAPTTTGVSRRREPDNLPEPGSAPGPVRPLSFSCFPMPGADGRTGADQPVYTRSVQGPHSGRTTRGAGIVARAALQGRIRSKPPIKFWHPGTDGAAAGGIPLPSPPGFAPGMKPPHFGCASLGGTARRTDYPPQEVEGQRDESVDTRQAGETVTPTGLKRGGKAEKTVTLDRPDRRPAKRKGRWRVWIYESSPRSGRAASFAAAICRPREKHTATDASRKKTALMPAKHQRQIARGNN